MNIILISSTKFGFSCLKELLCSSHTVSAIITTKREIAISYEENKVTISNYYDFKDISNHHNIPLMYVQRDIMHLENEIEALKPDIIIAAGWYYMVPGSIRSIPRFGCTGFHASLLPKYAGGAPVNWAILNGEKKTGITFFMLEKGVDTGDIIDQKETIITLEDTCKTVYDRLTELACEILSKKLPLLEKGTLKLRKQDKSKQTIMPQRNPEDGVIYWNKSALEIYNLIRATTKPYPGAFTFYKETKLIIWEAKLYNGINVKVEPGTILDLVSDKNHEGILVSTGDINTQLLLTRISLNGVEGDLPIDRAIELNIKQGDLLGK